jgi:hypothetical protein
MQSQTRQRLRFVDMTSTPQSDGTRRVVVEVEWMGAHHRGEAMGTGTLEGDLRATGEATVAAARAATAGKVSIALVGIKAVRAFDGRVIIAAVEVRASGPAFKLLGAHALTESDVPREGVLTVLGALNRVLGPLLARDPALATQPSGEADDGPR